jgi:hypothetical protein
LGDIDVDINKLTNEKDKIELSNFALDSFFGPILFNKNIQLWNKLSNKKKIDSIVDIIVSLSKEKK